ncbi:hypothetical protein FRC15_002402 [Serendipita sp. 397]|nr:hypothetical protein FRC15_002402 [Serendipita sp. 397]
MALPDQSYLDMGNSKEAGSNMQIFGASRVKSKKRVNNGVLVNGGSPLNAPPMRPSVSSEDDSVQEKEAERMEAEKLRARRHMSPPLPPLPTSTPEPTAGHQRSKSKDAKSDGAQPAPGPNASSSSSRPASRATVKGSRLTSTSIASNKRVSAAPSPRVSSLYHSRTSSHSYTPASPGLPHPQIPPMPILPAFLQQQNQQPIDRSSSVRTVRSLTSDSIGSVRNNPGHHTAASSTLLHDSTVPPSVVSDNSADDMSGTIHDPTKGVDGKALPRTMVVTATFTPGLSDELPLTIGETVCMLEEYIDGWCFVQRVKVLVKDASKLNEPRKGGILVGVNGTIDPENTYTVPVEGDGNSGAVPRFCVSEWPLSIAAMLELIEQQGDEQELNMPALDVEQLGLTPQIFASQTSPDAQTVTIPPPARLQPPPHTLAPPFTPPSALRRKGPNDLNIPTPSDVPDSKFSSWGSMLPTGTHMPGIYSTMQNTNRPTDLSPPPPPSSSALTTSIPTPRISPPPPAAAAPLPNSNSKQNLAPPMKSPRKETVSSNSSSTTGPSEEDASRMQSPASHVPPGPPPTSPIADTPIEEDDGIKRVSKPPGAPRLSRFPPSPEDDNGARLYQPGMQGTQDQNVGGAPGASGANGAALHSPIPLPRASERTVTMPPLPRRPTGTDPLPELPSLQNNSGNNQQSKYGVVNANNPQWGSVALPSALSSAMETGLGSSVMGSSVGSKTPSTGRSMGSSISKRFTSFAGGPRERSGSSSSLSGGGGTSRPGMMDRKASGPGVVSFKALRTGSATANVAAVATGR